MEAPEQPAKCKVCAASILQDEIKREDDYEDDCEENDEQPVECSLCKEALYCGEKCKTADLDGCKVKAQERVLAMQKKCFVCDKRIEGEEVHCGICGRIKYCSGNCQNADKEKHDLICNAYAELSPRPSKAHRICIFFPAEEQKLRLVWVRPYDHHAVKTLVTPQGLDTEFAAGPRVEPDDKDPSTYRDVVFFHADTYLFRTELAYNQSLGFAAVGRPMKPVRGSMMVTVSECSDVEDGVFQSDITPGDFLAVLRHSSRAEAAHGSAPPMRTYYRTSGGVPVCGFTTR